MPMRGDPGRRFGLGPRAVPRPVAGAVDLRGMSLDPRDTDGLRGRGAVTGPPPLPPAPTAPVPVAPLGYGGAAPDGGGERLLAALRRWVYVSGLTLAGLTVIRQAAEAVRLVGELRGAQAGGGPTAPAGRPELELALGGAT